MRDKQEAPLPQGRGACVPQQDPVNRPPTHVTPTSTTDNMR